MPINQEFVLDRNYKLYINNTEYMEEMNNDGWVKLEDIF